MFIKVVIESELILSDLQIVEKRLESAAKKSKFASGNDEMINRYRKIADALNNGQLLANCSWDEKEWSLILDMKLLSSKPMIYVCNVEEEAISKGNKHSTAVQKFVTSRKSSGIF